MNLFNEGDYKAILLYWAATQGPGKRGFYRKLSDYLNVNPSLVSQILSGPKDFTEEQIISVCDFLGLPQLESRYVLTLLQIERAGSEKLKAYHQTALNEIREKALDLSKRIHTTRHLTESEKAKFYSSWIYSAVHLMTTLRPAPKFQDICKRLNLNQDRAQEILSFLLEKGLIIEQNSRYTPGPTITHLEKSSPEISHFHKNWRQKAMDAAESLQPEEFMYSCNFTVSKKDFLKLREEFAQVTQKFLAIAQESDPEDLAQLNIDLFWLRS